MTNDEKKPIFISQDVFGAHGHGAFLCVAVCGPPVARDIEFI